MKMERSKKCAWFGIVVLWLLCDVTLVPKRVDTYSTSGSSQSILVMGFSFNVISSNIPRFRRQQGEESTSTRSCPPLTAIKPLGICRQRDGHGFALRCSTVRQIEAVKSDTKVALKVNGFDIEAPHKRQRRQLLTNPLSALDLTIVKDMKSIIFGFLLFTSIIFIPQHALANDEITTENAAAETSSPSTSTTTTATNNAMSKLRYWNMIESGDQSQVQFANERLLDHAVGTIMTMYYDNSGGLNFDPKELYDRWKVMRVYAKDGTNGVKELTAARDVSKTTSMDDTSEEIQRTKKDTYIPQLFLVEAKDGITGVQVQEKHFFYEKDSVPKRIMPSAAFDNRDNTVKSLKWLVSTLDDRYSRYLTRDELNAELQVKNDGFLGLGAIVEPPAPKSAGSEKILGGVTYVESVLVQSQNQGSSFLTTTRVSNLPRVTAIAPDSPAERSGIVVGDRIAGVGSDKFIGLGRDEIVKRLDGVYTGADNYIGHPDLTIAKPVIRAVVDLTDDEMMRINDLTYGDGSPGKEELIGYKLSRVRLPTASLEPFKPYKGTNDQINQNSGEEQRSNVYLTDLVPPASAVTAEAKTILSGGDSIVHWELLTPNNSIFQKYNFGSNEGSSKSITDKIGYIRLTRFSRRSTAGYSKAVEELERAGAQSYIIDVRNNYGGIIQESMLTAATLLRDPHTVLCYTMNSRGGFTPHDAEEYIVDDRYPGYFLSSEPKSSTFDQVKRENPDFVAKDGGWVPPSAYASIREQRITRNYNRPTGIASINPFQNRYNKNKQAEELKELQAQKQVVILMNEGTASAAEVFVSSLHDNGRTVALVGTKTYGKGLIQHTFPMPDGGGLRLTVAEYLTPALQHVTKVGGANFDKNGEFTGGGVKPDVYCPSTQGIPTNVGADICVGLAMDALENANVEDLQMAMNTDTSDNNLAGRKGGTEGGSFRRRTLEQGILRDIF